VETVTGSSLFSSPLFSAPLPSPFPSLKESGAEERVGERERVQGRDLFGEFKKAEHKT